MPLRRTPYLSGRRFKVTDSTESYPYLGFGSRSTATGQGKKRSGHLEIRRRRRRRVRPERAAPRREVPREDRIRRAQVLPGEIEAGPRVDRAVQLRQRAHRLAGPGVAPTALARPRRRRAGVYSRAALPSPPRSSSRRHPDRRPSPADLLPADANIRTSSTCKTNKRRDAAAHDQIVGVAVTQQRQRQEDRRHQRQQEPVPARVVVPFAPPETTPTPRSAPRTRSPRTAGTAPASGSGPHPAAASAVKPGLTR